jgi:hypothetical protein
MPITQERMVAILTEAERLFHQLEDLRIDLLERIAAQYLSAQPLKDFLSDLALAIERAKAEPGKAMLIERYHFDRTWKHNERMKQIQQNRRRSQGIGEPKISQHRPQLGEHLQNSRLDKVQAALARAEELARDQDPDAMRPEVFALADQAFDPEIPLDKLTPEQQAELQRQYDLQMGGKPSVPELI